jgi:hypothetical protein
MNLSFFVQRFGSMLDDTTLAHIHRSFRKHDVDNILSVLDLLQSLPPTSVKNETCFSAMKLTKGKRRGRLNNSTLDNLLSVQLQAESIEDFNPELAGKLAVQITICM